MMSDCRALINVIETDFGEIVWWPAWKTPLYLIRPVGTTLYKPMVKPIRFLED